MLGTALDGIHAYGDVLTYPHTAFGRWAWFVPLEFGLLGAAVAAAIPTLERLAAPEGGFRWTPAARATELALFATFYVSTALVGDDAALPLAVALAALALARLGLFGVKGDWAYVLLAATLGPAAEAALAGLGAFHYNHPDFAGVPWWLPALWANGGFLIRRLLRPIVIGSESSRPAPRTALGRS